MTTDPADRSTGGAVLPQVTGDLRSNYGPTIADRRHVLTANFVWEIPWTHRLQGVAKHVLDGWQFSGVQTFQTGLPLTAVLGNGGCASGTGANCNDPTGSGCLLGASPLGCRPNLIGNPNSGTSTYAQWFNLAAFAVPGTTQTTQTTEPPGAIRGPGFGRTYLS